VLTATRRARLVRAWQSGLPAPWDTALAGAALAYRGGLALRRAAYALGLRRARSLPCPVVAVGNLTVGGTGKTPLVETIARRLAGRGRRVTIVSRGYGRSPASDVRLVSDGRGLRLTPAEAGDEPFLLARRLLAERVAVVVGRDRFRAGAWALQQTGADVLLLDDGFQQRRLRKDVDVVCLDARAPWGCRGLFPRGTLREPPGALERAHLLVLSHADGVDLAQTAAVLRARAPAAPVAVATYEVEGVEEVRTGARAPIDALRDRAVLAFAGIAVPENFLETLETLGVAPRAFVPFPDHHRYTATDLAGLRSQAGAVGATALVTTEKDAVRLPAAATLPVWAVRVRLRLREPDAPWWAALEARLGAAGRR
jgi:tetraacyldisaccharide 4'-kinase